MIGEELVFFSFLYIKLFELGVKVAQAFNNRSPVTTTSEVKIAFIISQKEIM